MTKRESPLKPGDLLQGQFEVRRPLGAGGYGFVFHAYDQIMGRDVALKLIEIPSASHRDRQQRARLEAQVMDRLSHPNVVRVYAGGVWGDCWIYLVMELLHGRSLGQALLEHRRLSPREALRIGAQIADGVHAAHLAGIIHRDLKPDNVFIEKANFVRVIDFGVAKVQGPESPTTQRALVHGTGLYMSPEHMLGERVTPRSDIFALGVILYEALYGCCPALVGLQVPTLELMAENQLRQMPPPLHELVGTIPPFVSCVVQRMLAKNPAERMDDMADVANALRDTDSRLDQEGARHTLQERDLSTPGEEPPADERPASRLATLTEPRRASSQELASTAFTRATVPVGRYLVAEALRTQPTREAPGTAQRAHRRAAGAGVLCGAVAGLAIAHAVNAQAPRPVVAATFAGTAQASALPAATVATPMASTNPAPPPTPRASAAPKPQPVIRAPRAKKSAIPAHRAAHTSKSWIQVRND